MMSVVGHSPYQHSTPCAPQHTGYYPMHPVASSQGSHQGVAYSPFRTPNQRESYSHVGSTYSQAPPSYHRSVTPTSSRSGRSHHSHHSNDGSVKYAHCDRVSMPVNLWQQRWHSRQFVTSTVALEIFVTSSVTLKTLTFCDINDDTQDSVWHQ